MVKSDAFFCFLVLLFVRKLMLGMGMSVEFLGLRAGDVFGELVFCLGVSVVLVVFVDVGVMVLVCLVVFVESCLLFDIVGVLLLNCWGLLLNVFLPFTLTLFGSGFLSPVLFPSARSGLSVILSALSNSALLFVEGGVFFFVFVIVDFSARRSWYTFYRGEKSVFGLLGFYFVES